MLFKTPLEKKLIQENASTSQEKGKRRSNLTNTQGKSHSTFDLSI